MNKLLLRHFGYLRPITINLNILNTPLLNTNNRFSFSTIKGKIDNKEWFTPPSDQQYKSFRVQENDGQLKRDQRKTRDEEARREEEDRIVYHKDPNVSFVHNLVEKDRKNMSGPNVKEEKRIEKKVLKQDPKQFINQKASVFQQQQYQQSNSYGSPRSYEKPNSQINFQQKYAYEKQSNEKQSHNKKFDNKSENNSKKDVKIETDSKKKYNPMGKNFQEGDEPYHQKGGQQSHHPLNNNNTQSERKENIHSTSAYNTYQPAKKK